MTTISWFEIIGKFTVVAAGFAFLGCSVWLAEDYYNLRKIVTGLQEYFEGLDNYDSQMRDRVAILESKINEKGIKK